MRNLVLAALAGLLVTAAAMAQQAGQGEAKPGVAPPAVQAVPLQPVPPVQPGLPGQPFPGLGGGDPGALMEKTRLDMAKMMGLRVPPAGVKWGGASLEPAGEALLDQLGQTAGMVVTAVESDSAADKAGLKKHDVVIKVNDKDVARDAKEMVKALGKNEAETPIDLVVLRKGKEQTLKAVKLPEVALAPTGGLPGFPGGGIVLPPLDPKLLPGFDPKIPGLDPKLLDPKLGGFPFPPGGINIGGAKINVSRDKDDFTATHEKDKVKITVKGKIDGKTAKVEEITVAEGDSSKKYDKVKDVPEAQRDTVDRLIRFVSGDPSGLAPIPGGLPKLPGGLPDPGLRVPPELPKDPK